MPRFRILVLALALALALATMVSGCAPRSESIARSEIEIIDPVIGETDAGRGAALYFSLVQRGGRDILLDITADYTSRVTVMGASMTIGASSETSGFPIDIDAGSTIKFLPGGRHVMLEQVTQDLAAGDTVVFTLKFEQHSPIIVVAAVVPVAELLDRTDTP